MHLKIFMIVTHIVTRCVLNVQIRRYVMCYIIQRCTFTFKAQTKPNQLQISLPIGTNANLLASLCQRLDQFDSGTRSLQERTTSNRCCVTVSTAVELSDTLLHGSRTDGCLLLDTPCSSGWRKAEIEAGLEMPAVCEWVGVGENKGLIFVW